MTLISKKTFIFLIVVALFVGVGYYVFIQDKVFGARTANPGSSFPSQSGNDGKLLQTNGTDVVWTATSSLGIQSQSVGAGGLTLVGSTSISVATNTIGFNITPETGAVYKLFLQWPGNSTHQDVAKLVISGDGTVGNYSSPSLRSSGGTASAVDQNSAFLSQTTFSTYTNFLDLEIFNLSGGKSAYTGFYKSRNLGGYYINGEHTTTGDITSIFLIGQSYTDTFGAGTVFYLYKY